MNTISILAGLSVILLVIELLVVVIVVGAIVYFIRRGIIAGRREVAPYVEQATTYVYRVEELTKKFSALIINSQVEAISTVRGIQRGLRALIEHE